MKNTLANLLLLFFLSFYQLFIIKRKIDDSKNYLENVDNLQSI